MRVRVPQMYCTFQATCMRARSAPHRAIFARIHARAPLQRATYASLKDELTGRSSGPRSELGTFPQPAKARLL